MAQTNKQNQRIRRHHVVRTKVKGTTLRPRLSVFRSNKYIYAQIIDDQVGKTVVGVSQKELPEKLPSKIERAAALGELLAKKARECKIKEVVFDRGGYKYHGRVKSLAEGARKGGLEF